MKKSRFSEMQIVKILREAEAGMALDELSRQLGFSCSTFYKQHLLQVEGQVQRLRYQPALRDGRGEP